MKKKYDNSESSVRNLNFKLLKETAKYSTIIERRALFDHRGVTAKQFSRFNEPQNQFAKGDAVKKVFTSGKRRPAACKKTEKHVRQR